MEQLLKLNELALEAHVWENDRSFLTGVLKSFLELPIFLLHEVGDHSTCASRDASVTVNEYTTLSHTFFNERNCSREMPDQARLASVSNADDLIFEVFREERLDSGCHLEHMSNPSSFHCVHI